MEIKKRSKSMERLIQQEEWVVDRIKKLITRIRISNFAIYLNDKKNKFFDLIRKNKNATAIVCLSIIIIIQMFIIIKLIVPQRAIDNNVRDAIVNFFYPRTDQAVSRSIIETQIDTILKSKYPELELSIWFWESRGNPGAVGQTVHLAHRGVSVARGAFQIIPGWAKKLKEDGIIYDDRDLHDPVKGCIAGDKVLGYHLTRANGDMMAALRDYVGSHDRPGNVSYVQNVLTTYGNLKLLEVAAKEHALGNDLDKWWAFTKEEKKSKIMVNKKKKKIEEDE